MKSTNNFKKIALVAAFALAGAGAWGQTQAPIASWDLRYGTSSTPNIYSIGISMVGSSPMVSVKKSGNAYSHFIVGYIVDSVWYIWQAKESTLGRTTYDWVAMDSGTAVAKMLASIRSDTAKDATDTKTIESQKLQSERFYYSAKVNNFDIQPSVQSTGWVKSYATSIGLGGLVTARLDMLNGRAGGGQVVVALYDQAGLKLDGLAFTWEGECFDGERAFFARTSTEKPYYKMVLALLGVYFESHGAGDFKSAMAQIYKNDLKMETSDWKMFDSALDKEAYALRAATALGNNLTGFLKGTIHMPAYRSGTSMVDASSKNVFDIDINGKVGEKISLYDSIYGSHANPYIQSYLYYTFIKNKPVFSAEAARQGALSYDWNQYTQIEKSEGKAIAAAAMRYLTWGVEYLLPSRDSTQDTIPAERYGQSFYNIALAAGWFSGSGGTATANYYTGSLTTPLTSLATERSGTGTTVTLPTFIGSLSQVYFTPLASGSAASPIPFAREGLDSPRTFGYKMEMQLKTRLALNPGYTVAGTTAPSGYGGSTYQYYIDKKNSLISNGTKDGTAVTVLKDGSPIKVRPFMPGGSSASMADAGVDAFGLLTGCVAMTDVASKVLSVSGIAPAAYLDKYYAMDKTADGVDAEGKPKYSELPNPAELMSMRLRPGDLERASVIVPDISLIREGDLIVRFGSAAGESYDQTQIGIVVGIAGTPPAYGDDDKSFMENVYVVSIRSGFKQVSLGTWGNKAGTFGGFSIVPERFHIRRLLKKAGGTGIASYVPATWDICGSIPKTMEIDVAGMSEQTRVFGGTSEEASASRGTTIERWIPNTGEYLAFWKLGIKLLNSADVPIDVDRFYKDKIEVYPDGATDRGFSTDTGGAQGNIYKNTACLFELALVDVSGTVFDKIGELTAPVDGIYGFNPNGSVLYNGDGSLKKEKYRLTINAKGYLEGSTANGGTGLFLAIRPLNSASARPGDDLQLKFKCRIAGLSDTFAPGSMEASDYVAVYDKKMLWRANLYIDEGTNDWNDVHPWNAPADSGNMVRKNAGDVNEVAVATICSWWSEAWGYNEWNRKFSLGQPFTGVATVGLDNLPVGDGTQIVELPSFAPIRSLKSPSGVEKAKNIISGTVAYSYPKHGYEATAAWTPQIEEKGLRQAGDPIWGFSTTGDPGSMDSPFDFVWKMRKLVGVLDDEISASPNTYSWWDYNVTKPVGTIGTTTLQPSMFRYVPSLGLYLNTPWHVTNEGYSASPNTIASMADDPDTWFVQTGALDYTSGDTTYKIVYLDGADNHQMRRNASWIIEAGTDCIGFAQRAASWRYKDSDASADQAPYAWTRMPRGVMEYNLGAGTENPYDTFASYGTASVGNRKYPIEDTTESSVVVSRLVLPSTTAQPDISLLRRIIPGDIFVKDSATDTTETVTKDHIAIVQSVPSDPYSITDSKVYMSQIMLIEGEYTNLIQSVINRLSVGDYNQGKVIGPIQFYPAFSLDKDVELGLNCQFWAIRRLK